MFYYLYKITNQVNGKIYIGVHETDDLEDGYMGSGVALNRAMKKHGHENFTKEILMSFGDRESMYETEAAIVDETLVEDRNYYNISIGGRGGNTFAGFTNERMNEHKKKLSKIVKERCKTPEHKKKMSELAKKRNSNPKWKKNHSEKLKKTCNTPEYRNRISEIRSDDEYRKRHSKIIKEKWSDPDYKKKMYKIQSSEEYRKKISEAAKKRWADPEYRKKMSEIHRKRQAK